MYIKELRCPECERRFVVDGALWEIGTVRVRCTACAHLFLPPGSPHSRSVEHVANASVPIAIWEPDESPETA
jgi:predicted Zn finger-like uncharacterized protein